MPYRRANISGAIYFITANLVERDVRDAISLTDHIGIVRDPLRHVKSSHPCQIEAMVELPDHFHLLMTLQPDDANYSYRVGAIKSAFSRQHPKTEAIGVSRKAKRERGIRDDRDFAKHVNCIHINPVKHAYVKPAVDWPRSTIHRFIARGVIDTNLAADVGNGEFGEG